ncbi:MAG: hypothetical protein HY834_08680 [Devosia nanyangense]|uniref:Uncharacterized protein n=1 Tax=Devosia nanyangense TaxID=1228055 RepID=A0A933L260_9HYPH|nr:hypothetical protein [Devosia nanyangense]
MHKILPCLLGAALAATLPVSFAAFTVTPALANYSCEPGQPNCVPMGVNTKPTPTPWPEIACRVAGDPEALPDDLRFRNIGDVVIKAGSAVIWQLKQTGEHGTFHLEHDLLVGADIDDVDILKAGVPANTRCLSRLA